MFNAKKMGETIKSLRGERSQDECARALGISRGALSFYENGDRRPDADVICRMSEYFEVPADYILGLSSVDSYDIDLQSVCGYTGLSKDVIEKIRSYFFMPVGNPNFEKLRQSTIEAGHDIENNYIQLREITNELLLIDIFWSIVHTLLEISQTCKKLNEFIPEDIFGDKYIEEVNSNGHASAETYSMLHEYNKMNDRVDLDRYFIYQNIEKLCGMFDTRDEIRQTTEFKKYLDKIFEYRAYLDKNKRDETNGKINEILKTVQETAKALEEESEGKI